MDSYLYQFIIHKSLIFITAIVFLTACTPKDTAFKSDVRVVKVKKSIQVTDSTRELPRIPFREKYSAEDISVLPREINLDVPFFPQAPDGIWELPWKEACEEASVVLAYYYAVGKPLAISVFKKDVLKLVEWQTLHYGDYIHTNMGRTAKMFNDYFGYDDFEILDNPTINEMKTALSSGYIIIAPFSGKGLNNPFYSNGGPYYHVMIIKGYEKENFITNDVGTRRGKDFLYSYDTIMSAMHDYNPDNIKAGIRRVIIVR